MNINDIKELLELIQDSGVEEFEMEKAGVRLRIRNSRRTASGSGQVEGETLGVGSRPTPPSEAVAEEEPEEGIHIFTAPIVGTFYLTPKPDAEPFVEIGDRVSESKVICIIEAMKIFNQIECDVSGEIIDILVENGQPVEYGEPLFKIRTS